MKQKLTRALIDEIRKEMPVLTEMEMRCCNGGDGGTVSWDCLFNCMNAIDPSRSAQEYAKEYADRYNLDPNTMGGVPENYINDVLTTLGFNNVPTNSMTPSREYHQIVAIENHDGTAHAVRSLGLPVRLEILEKMRALPQRDSPGRHRQRCPHHQHRGDGGIRKSRVCVKNLA